MKIVSDEEAAVRAHDIVVCMERSRSEEFETLNTLGLAVRLALHLRGVPEIEYELLKKVAVHVLNFAPTEVKPAVQLLAETEFALLISEGKTIKKVVPDVPYFDDLYKKIGEVARADGGMTEAEQLTLLMVHKLSDAPLFKSQMYEEGAEKKLVEQVLHIGQDAAFVLKRRARGKDILLSPSYFAESGQAYADLVAANGAERVKKVLKLLRLNQGWPLTKIVKEGEINGTRLTPEEIQILVALAGDGFVQPPAIKTTHGGTNHFLFGPRPGKERLPLTKKTIYERAMALVAAVRQGQLLPEQFAIRSPVALLSSFKSKGFLRTNSEAWEQYRQVAEMRIGRLVPHGVGHRLVLIDTPENQETVDLAIQLVSSPTIAHKTDEDVVLALKRGHSYVESLIGRKLVEASVVPLDPEAQDEIDTLVLGGKA